MNQLESRIRDYLADHLELLGNNLTLISREYKLDNDFGAGGSIDILARDAFGHFVVIEIKRSDQAARAAIHELQKYIALLRADQGLRSDQVRAILVSTHWHELAVPFSEYLKISDIPTEGFILVAAAVREQDACSLGLHELEANDPSPDEHGVLEYRYQEVRH